MSFLEVLAIGITMVVLQGVAAAFDGYFNQKQMRVHGYYGFAFIEHGGMWADIFLVSPAMADIVSKYKLNYNSRASHMILIGVIIFTLTMMNKYKNEGVCKPEAHTHHGNQTVAGWIHGLFAAVSMWLLILFYFTTTTPKASAHDLILVTSLFTIWAPLGVIKFFNPLWKWTKSLSWTVSIEIAAFWLIAGIKIYIQQ